MRRLEGAEEGAGPGGVLAAGGRAESRYTRQSGQGAH